jgi:alpha-glucosidase
LLPYLYSLAWQAHTHGQPLMRPLVYHYPDDPNVWELDSQFLLGPNLLVAPVTRAGATHWTVYLPAGDWYDFWTGERFTGRRSITVATPLDTLPLFVRGGSVVPLGPVMQRSDERPLDDLTLLVYPGLVPPGQMDPGQMDPGGAAESAGACQLYEDDGRTQQHRAGRFSLTDVRVSSSSGTVHIEAGPASGEYDGQPAVRTVTFRVWLPVAPRTVRVSRGGTEVAVRPLPANTDASASDASTPDASAPDDSATDVTWRYEHPSSCAVRIPGVHRDEALSIHLTLEEGNELRG